MNSHYIEGFLIGTKKNANGWQVSRDTLPRLVDGFIGKPFTIIPEKLLHGIDAHFHGATKQETIDGYNAYSHGIIEKVTGPFSYNDGTDDFYYKHITRLSNSKAASLLAEYGARSKVPFSVSPHIWHEDPDISDYVQNFTPIGVSLVDQGAYGSIAIINRTCQGTKDACHRSLMASLQYTDEDIAKIVSSHLSKSASFPQKMSINTNDNTTTIGGTKLEVPSPPGNPTLNPQSHLTQQEPQVQEKIFLTKEQYDLIQREKAEFENTKKRLETLENEHKTNVLSNIFANDIVTDETTRNNLIEKWKTVDVKMVKDLYQDFNSAILPVIVERAKKEALDAAGKSKGDTSESTLPTERSKGSATLRAEPKAPCNCNKNKAPAEQSVQTQGELQQPDKSASNTNRVSEVALLRKYLFSKR